MSKERLFAPNSFKIFKELCEGKKVDLFIKISQISNCNGADVSAVTLFQSDLRKKL